MLVFELAERAGTSVRLAAQDSKDGSQ
jgi:hypothetical protein